MTRGVYMRLSSKGQKRARIVHGIECGICAAYLLIKGLYRCCLVFACGYVACVIVYMLQTICGVAN